MNGSYWRMGGTISRNPIFTLQCTGRLITYALQPKYNSINCFTATRIFIIVLHYSVLPHARNLNKIACIVTWQSSRFNPARSCIGERLAARLISAQSYKLTRPHAARCHIFLSLQTGPFACLLSKFRCTSCMEPPPCLSRVRGGVVGKVGVPSQIPL